MRVEESTRPTSERSLVGLLGDARAHVIDLLRARGPLTAGELAAAIGTSHVAVRRHLQSLEAEGYVAARVVPQPRGRPAAHWHLTDGARRLFPDRSAAVASELIEFITDQHGREGLRAYLRWRQDRETASYGAVVDADDLSDRVAQLAGALTDAGFDATVEPDGDGGFKLIQSHCCVYDVAKDHPEVCAYEAATFQRVLGAKVSRRETLTNGHDACVCTVRAATTPEGAAV